MAKHSMACAAILLLGACQPAAAPIDDPAVIKADPAARAVARKAEAAEAALTLDAKGLRLVDTATGSTSLLAFGTPRATAEAAVGKIAGVIDDSSSNDECGAGPMQFARYDGLTLNYQDGKFVGWNLMNEAGAPVYTTMSGIGIGTTRAKASESVTIMSVEGSTLGEEFSIGTGDAVIGGLFAKAGATAPIDSLYAGTNCFFR